MAIYNNFSEEILSKKTPKKTIFVLEEIEKVQYKLRI